MPSKPQRSGRRPPSLPGRCLGAAALLMALLAITLTAALLVGEHEDREAQAQLDFRAREAAARVAAHLEATEVALRGAAAFLAAEGLQDAQGFGAYVQALRLELFHPGVAGLAFCRLEPGAGFSRVPWEGFPCGDQRLEQALDGAAAEGTLRPAASLRPPAAEPRWREAMDRARDEGRAAVSGRVPLGGEAEGRSGQAVYVAVPLYGPGPPPVSVLERRLRLAGWVYAPVRLDALEAAAAGRAGGALTVALQAGPPASAGSRLLLEPEPPRAQGRYQARAAVGAGDRRWAVVVSSGPALDEALAGASLQVPVATAGVLLAALVTGLVLAEGRGRVRAATEAGRLRGDLEAADHTLAAKEAALDSLAEALDSCDQTADRLLELAHAAGQPGEGEEPPADPVASGPRRE